ncbi:MAG: hypothetical protein ACFFDX_05975 [Candidatus Odinarchaeota archaeon]
MEKMNSTLFDLYKIKELTLTIEDLQAKIHKLNELKKILIQDRDNFIESINDNDISNQYQDLIVHIENLHNQLIKVSKENLNTYFFYQEKLINKYKEALKEKLKIVKIDEKITKNIGVTLIENKQVCKPIDKVSFIPSIKLNQWLDIIDSLSQYSIFLNTIKKVSKFYSVLINEKFNKKLSEIPKDTDVKLIQNYKKAFLKNTNLEFVDFIQEMERNLSQEDLKIQKKIIQKAKEKEEIEKLKKRQKEQQEGYQNYLNLSESEFERLRRRKKREKLEDVTLKPKDLNEIEIPEDISKKIEEFKSKFETSFRKNHLIEENENKDPLELIRERKKKKEKEYKKFKKHFEEI